MKKRTVANWLFYYYLTGTVVMGLVLIIFGSGEISLQLDDSLGVFAIIIPVFIGQLTIIYQWYTNQAVNGDSNMDQNLSISPSLVKIPALVVFGIFLLAITLRAYGIKNDIKIMGDPQFKQMVTFAMSILNATTVYLVAMFYRPAESAEATHE